MKRKKKYNRDGGDGGDKEYNRDAGDKDLIVFIPSIPFIPV